MYMTLTVVAYALTFLVIVYVDATPPYNSYPKRLGFYFFYLYAIPLTTCFFIVVITTVSLIINLRRQQRWRRETASQSDKSSDKENKLVRTIIAISTLFIICSFPYVAIFITEAVYPPYRHKDPYLGSLSTIILSVSGVFQAVSSAVNIFFYYRMSSRFNKVFSACFLLKKKEDSIKE